MRNAKIFTTEIVFESNTTYVGEEKIYDIYPDDNMEEIYAWWTCLNSGNVPLRAAFVLRNLRNVTIDLRGAKIVFHGRILPFAICDCENVTIKNFSIDYDRPFYTQGTVVASENNSVIIEIPELFSYRIEGHDFIACADTWEHRLNTGDMLFRCFDPESKLPSKHTGAILGLIGDEIFPRSNPPFPICHIKAEDLGDRKVRLFDLPNGFKPLIGEILAMTHEDRRKPAILLERCRDTVVEHVRLLYTPSYGIMSKLCHNITLDDFSMYLDDETTGRVVTANADSFHTFHSTGLMKVENCRFENMLDDAINIHGKYLVCSKKIDNKTIIAENFSPSIRAMQFLFPNDEYVIYKGNTQEVRCAGTVCSAIYLPDQYRKMKLTFNEPIECDIEKGDCLEVLRMPEIEVRNCHSKCIGAFRISSGKRVLIEDCTFETIDFGVAFTGDMDYWYENTGVKDVTIRNCKFIKCGIPLVTACGFKPTEKAPFYHQNIKFINNEIVEPKGSTVCLSDVNNFVYKNNTVVGEKENVETLSLHRCTNVLLE